MFVAGFEESWDSLAGCHIVIQAVSRTSNGCTHEQCKPSATCLFVIVQGTCNATVAPFMVMQTHKVNSCMVFCIGHRHTSKHACVCVRPVLACWHKSWGIKFVNCIAIKMLQLMHLLCSQIGFDFESNLGWQFHELSHINWRQTLHRQCSSVA